MAKTIFDAPPPRPGRSLKPYLAAPEPMEPAEKEVAAEPRLTRAVVGYLEPREGIDGLSYYNQCASCVAFIPEGMMRGAVRGARCAKFDSDFPVTDDSGCNLYTPTPDGKPCGHCAEHAAEKVIKGQRGSVSPWTVGFVRDKKRRCETCRQFEFGEGDAGPECSLMEAMNEALPAVFQMEAKVKPGAKCDMWCDYPEPMP